MAKQKSIHEILILMYDRYVKDIDPNHPTETLCYSGLCELVGALWAYSKINVKEYDIIRKYIYANRPKKKRKDEFFWINYIRRYRLKWMKEHIELTK